MGSSLREEEMLYVFMKNASSFMKNATTSMFSGILQAKVVAVPLPE